VLKLKWLVPLVIVAAGGGYYYMNYDVAGLADRLFKPRGATPKDAADADPAPDQPPAGRRGDLIRIASFNLGMFDRDKLKRPHVARFLAEAIRGFDILAVQDIRARNKGVLLDLVELVNSKSRHYDFATAPGVGRDDTEQYVAFLFDRASVEIDRRTVGAVTDPAGRFRQTPLLASFRVRGPDAKQAFTFTLINVHVDLNSVDSNGAKEELELLDEVFRAVRDDGRGEDDIIMLGDFEADDQVLTRFGGSIGLSCAISDVPSTTRGGRLTDNILFNRHATIEFTGRSGVLDMMRKFNLSMQEALQVSDHLPVWGEFSVYEGGQAGHVTSGASDPTR